MIKRVLFFCLIIGGFYNSCQPFSPLSQNHNKSRYLESGKTFVRPQEQAQQEIIHYYNKRIDDLNELSAQAFATQAGILLQESLERIEILEKTKQESGNYDAHFLGFLRDQVVAKINEISAHRNIAPDSKSYATAKAEAKTRLAILSPRLRDALLETQSNSDMMNWVFQLLAFSRSETLGDGRIGRWSPGSSDAIQGSAINGLLWVLEEIRKNNINSESAGQANFQKPLSFDELMIWHKALLGNSEHSSSKGGQINEIYFKDENGNPEHASVRVSRWIEKINMSKGTVLEALSLYAEFLQLHPFGDSNGRIAEVGKSLVLAKGNFLPLVTREKTSVENFLYQKLFGLGFVEDEAVKQSIETLAIFDGLNSVIGKSEITSVDLLGSNVVIKITSPVKEQILVINRTYFFNPDEVGLPPVRGAPTVLDQENSRESYRLRYTQNSFKDARDIKPTTIITTERIGRMKLIFPVFVIDLEKEKQSDELIFQFLYDHPESGEVFFHNNGLNYTIANPMRLSINKFD